MDNALLVCLCICIFIIMSIFGASNFVGAINEQLEILTPNMRKIRLPRKLVRFVPQWCRTGCLHPEGAIYKSEVYVLTVILAIINYIYGVLSLVVAVVVFITCSEYLMCLLLLPIVWACVIWIIEGYYYFAIKKAGKDKFGRLESDFTVSDKKVEDDKSDEMPESMTDNQDECD